MEVNGKAVADIYYHTDPKQPITKCSNYTMFQKEIVNKLREAKAEEEKNV